MRAIIWSLLLLLASVRAEATPATDLFERGKTAYRLGELDEAIQHFRAAYREKPDPVFLYNIALAYRGKGDLEKAVSFYQSYLREAPDAANRDQVEAKIAELRRAIDEKQRAAEAPPKTPLPPQAVAPSPPPPPPPPPSRSRRPSLVIAGSVSGGLGVVAVVGGGLLLSRARATQAEITEAAAGHSAWNDELAGRDASARRNARLGLIGLGAGATLLAGGGVLLYLGLRGRTEVVPSVSSDGVGVAIRGSL